MDRIEAQHAADRFSWTQTRTTAIGYSARLARHLVVAWSLAVLLPPLVDGGFGAEARRTKRRASEVEPSVAGPKRPQDRGVLAAVAQSFRSAAEGVAAQVVKTRSLGWSPKAPARLGVKAVIAESYERIHRSNLVCRGCYHGSSRTAKRRDRSA